MKASQEVCEVAAIGMYESTTSTRLRLTDMLQNTGCFTGRSSSNGYSYHRYHFRLGWHVVNRSSEDSCSIRFCCARANVYNSVAASLDVFPHAIEQQHINFRWDVVEVDIL
ncbi:hypothetical protein TNCV_3282861 [Trichonephila clavipes]|nr:hypothetical protein TNCV_3282861 [Trichonephila clavipes]